MDLVTYGSDCELLRLVLSVNCNNSMAFTCSSLKASFAPLIINLSLLRVAQDFISLRYLQRVGQILLASNDENVKPLKEQAEANKLKTMKESWPMNLAAKGTTEKQ